MTLDVLYAEAAGRLRSLTRRVEAGLLSAEQVERLMRVCDEMQDAGGTPAPHQYIDDGEVPS